MIVDVTGEACQAATPTDVTKTCNAESCPECTSIELTTTKMADTLAVDLSGWYRRSGGEGTDYPEHMHGKVHFVHHGGKELFIYYVNAYGKGWWVIGPQLGSSYQWSAYIQSDADMPTMAADPWSTLGPDGTLIAPDGKGEGGSTTAVVVLEQHCACDSESLILDPISRSQCVHANQLDGSNRNTNTNSSSSSNPNEANNPVSTSTPQPEEGFMARTTRAPRQCPLYYAPGPNGCVRQYLCDNGVSSGGGSCDCGEDNSCTRCHLSSSGTIRCLRQRKDAS